MKPKTDDELLLNIRLHHFENQLAPITLHKGDGEAWSRALIARALGVTVAVARPIRQWLCG